ncbi:hypothetical protein A1O3_02873 [Capronia epimyces CBS 606.96]|uniref:Uncharacterized protein n=1 Tax=Capronia epimyces CBS 606.96 TaxID=1182542 RepID=W9YKN5_9EURO|nr:uncharacterized protein A1O3_02873 [Capronia epimyces CBS 606.96]EXJ89806.1 hypothetical protein A1O3_02873 [Capronia epimyces CBS 606.96]
MQTQTRTRYLTSLLSILLLLLTPRLAGATCYWQNSTLAPDDPYSIAPDDTACFPEQENSPCCGTGWTCLSDGVCYIEQEGSSFYYRGTCTDRTWDSQQCPGWCFAQNSNTSIPLIKCDSEQDWYCCPGDPDCSCSSGKDAVKLGDDQPSTITVIGSTSWPGFTSTTTPFTASPLVSVGTSTGSSTGAAITSEFAATSTPSTQSSKGSSTAGAAAASATPASPSSSSGGGGSSHSGLAAGLGAGLGAGAVLVGALCFFLIWSRRRRRRNAAANAGGLLYSGIPGNEYKGQPSYTSSHPSGYQDEQFPVGGSRGIGRPELAGAGEHDRSELPAVVKLPAVVNRAELNGS